MTMITTVIVTMMTMITMVIATTMTEIMSTH